PAHTIKLWKVTCSLYGAVRGHGTYRTLVAGFLSTVHIARVQTRPTNKRSTGQCGTLTPPE
ncbi:MAG: hypothetical protein ACPG4T_20975, partial [Nannocystaceae bacterium]